MKRRLLLSLGLFSLLHPQQVVWAEASQGLSVEDMPFTGYYVAPDDYAIEGLLFDERQLIIYVHNGGDIAGEHDHHHGHEAHDSHMHDVTEEVPHHDHEVDNVEGALSGQERVNALASLHSFPHPDLANYSEGLREHYLDELKLPYDLKGTYAEITQQITPEMSQTDIIHLINNTIPSIYYTEKDGYAYYIIANPDVEQVDNVWIVSLFGEEIIRLEGSGWRIEDEEGITYEFIDGIVPN